MLQRRFYAFTLIELMIVIAIIGILAGILVPNYMRARAEAQLAACEQNLTNIYRAVVMYRESPIYAQTKIIGGRLGDGNILIEAGFIKQVPRCPANGEYYWAYNPHTNNIRVCHYTDNCHKALGIRGDYPDYDEASGGIRYKAPPLGG